MKLSRKARRGSTSVTLGGFLFGFVGLGVGAALYYGELLLLKTSPNLPPSLAWQISWPAFAIGVIGFVVGFVSLFSDISNYGE